MPSLQIYHHFLKQQTCKHISPQVYIYSSTLLHFSSSLSLSLSLFPLLVNLFYTILLRLKIIIFPSYSRPCSDSMHLNRLTSNIYIRLCTFNMFIKRYCTFCFPVSYLLYLEFGYLSS